MTPSEQRMAFADDLDSLIERYSREFDLKYGDVLAALEMKKFLVCREAEERWKEEGGEHA